MPSISIRRSEHDPETRILSVWFVASGKRHDYEDVPVEIHAGLRNAFAKGRFFNENIRDRFRNRRVDTG